LAIDISCAPAAQTIVDSLGVASCAPFVNATDQGANPSALLIVPVIIETIQKKILIFLKISFLTRIKFHDIV
jgi:hypothetical protein